MDSEVFMVEDCVKTQADADEAPRLLPRYRPGTTSVRNFSTLMKTVKRRLFTFPRPHPPAVYSKFVGLIGVARFSRDSGGFLVEVDDDPLGLESLWVKLMAFQPPVSFFDPCVFKFRDLTYLAFEFCGVRNGSYRVGLGYCRFNAETEELSDPGVLLYAPELFAGRDSTISFPMPFQVNGDVYFTLESFSSGATYLYQLRESREGNSLEKHLGADARSTLTLERVREIGPALFDPILVEEDGRILLVGSDENYNLLGFEATNLQSTFRKFPTELLECDYRSGRNAGPVFSLGEERFRVFQDCRGTYGKEFGIARVGELDSGPSGFQEILQTTIVGGAGTELPWWFREKYHHFYPSDLIGNGRALVDAGIYFEIDSHGVDERPYS